MKKLVIKNETDWNGRDLRKLIRATLKKEGVWGKPYKVVVVHGKNVKWNQNQYSGLGAIGRPWFKLRVPKPMTFDRIEGSDGTSKWSEEKTPNKFSTVKAAAVMAHEIAHNRGEQHDAIGCKITRKDHDRVRDWAKDFTVRPKKSVVEAPETDKIRERYGHAKDKVVQWETKLKRGETYLKKWEKKVRYYERNYSEERLGVED